MQTKFWFRYVNHVLHILLLKLLRTIWFIVGSYCNQSSLYLSGKKSYQLSLCCCWHAYSNSSTFVFIYESRWQPYKIIRKMLLETNWSLFSTNLKCNKNVSSVTVRGELLFIYIYIYVICPQIDQILLHLKVPIAGLAYNRIRTRALKLNM